MKCPNCGRENPADAKFCMNCAHPLTSAEAEDPRQALLDRLLPQVLRDKIQASGTIEPERRPVTVLFADLSGFTALGEKLDPEELSALTNECLEAMVKSVFKYEGFVDKLIGDAVMALFGAPVAHEDDPERALRCALEMQKAVTEIAAVGQVAPDLSLHAGLHTGDVVAGPVGPDLRLDYTVMGDTVNLASRLSDAAKAGQVLVSPDLLRLTLHAFEFEETPSLILKGIEGEVRALSLTGLRAEPEPARGIQGLFSPLVGREKEFEILEQALEDVLDGKGQIITLMGEPGIGKSRLVEELQNLALSEHKDQIAWLEGRCLSYGSTIAYWPILEMMKGWAEIREEDTEAHSARKLRLALRRAIPDRLEENYPYLASLLGLKLDDASQEKVRYLDPEALQTRIFLAVRDWVEALAKDGAVVVVFEDLHWADPSTVAVLSHLLPATDEASAMLFLVSRPERDRPWWEVKIQAETEFPHRYAEINLQPLDQAESDLLIRNLLAIEDLPKGIKGSILEKTEGNPFFVEEIIRALIDEGVIVRQNGKWRATAKLLSLDVPDTVQGVILARIDRLPPQPRGLLQKASVIGRTFLYRILAFVADGDGQLREPLTRLQQVELIQEKTRRPELEYIFKHTLTQEVAYGTLVQDTLKDTHARVAQAIESLFPDRLEEFYGLLAHHYTGAEARDKAIDYLIKAGDQARAGYANREAVEFYGRAQELLEGSERDEDRRRDARLLEDWAEIHLLTHEIDEAAALFEKAAAAWGSLEEHSLEVQAIFRIAWAHSQGSRWRESAEAARRGLEMAEASGADAQVLAKGYIALSRPLYWGGLDQAQGRNYVEKALPLLEESDDAEGLGDAHRMLGLMVFDRLEKALTHHLRAAQEHTRAGNLGFAAMDFNNAGNVYYQQGRFDEALDATSKGLALAEKTGALNAYGVLVGTLSEIHVMLGNLDQAQEYAQEALETALRIHDRQVEEFAEMELGWVAEARADWDEAVRHYTRGLELSQYTTPFYRGIVLNALARIHQYTGQLDRAQELFDEAFSVADDLGEGDRRLLLGWLHGTTGVWHAAREEWDSAEEAFKKSLRVWDELDDPGIQRSRSVRDHGLMLLLRAHEGDEARGREMLDEAIGFFRSIGDQFDLGETERGLARLGLSLAEFDA